MGLRRGRPQARRAAFVAVCTIAAALLAALVDRAPTARAGGVGENGLGLSVTVNTRPGLGALQPGIRAGTPVVKVYRLTNYSGADLASVRLNDPGVPPSAVRCGGGSAHPGTLRALSRTVCTARFPAAPGPHTDWVTATGVIPSLGIRMTTSARSGYAGVAGQLSLSESPRLISFTEAEVRYVLTNPGNRTVLDVQLADPELLPARIDCSGRAVVPELPPGTSVTCTAQITRSPGTYHSAGTATGSDWTATLTPTGSSQAPPALTAHATTSFTLPTAPALPPAALAPPLPLPPGSPLGTPFPFRPQTPAPSPPQYRRTVPPRQSPTASAAPGPAVPPPGVQPPPAAPPGQLPGAAGPAAPGVPAVPPPIAAPLTPPGPLAPGIPVTPPFGGGVLGAAPAPPGGGAPGTAPAQPGGGILGAAPAQPGGGTLGTAPAPPGGGIQGAAPAQPGGGILGDAPAQPPAPVTPARPKPPGTREARGQESSVLARLRRRSRENSSLSVVAVLLLLLVPAALVAALLGSRRP
ncbi:hypothetical protein [Streptomyces sp. NPDC023838]|uniref:hypothetical protein n=1 Tax=Streptomyces sp. NPDC023838 TaxID=3154325 RepID=UPI003403687D